MAFILNSQHASTLLGFVVITLITIAFASEQGMGVHAPEVHMYPSNTHLCSLKRELQETIRDIQNNGDPPEFEKRLSETIKQLEYKQYPQVPSLDHLDWPRIDNNTPVLSRPLDVCIVVSSLEGLYVNSGIGTTYYSLAHLLAQQGSSVTITYTRDEPTAGGSFSEWVSYYKQFNITLKALPPSYKRIANPKLQSRSYRVYHYLKESSFDIVHFGDFEGLGYYSTVAKRAGLAFQNTTLIVGLHGPTRWVVDSNMNRGLVHESELEVDWMERISVEYADAVWTPSSYLASWLSNHSWILPSKVHLLPLPPGPEVQLEGAASTRLVRAKELVFFGRLETRKGLVLFCDALDLLAKMRFVKPSELVVTFMGTLGYVEGKDAGSYIRERAASWPFRIQILTDMNRTQALGYLSDPNESRLAVIPSLVDNAPYTVYECLYARIPFIASATPSITPLFAQEAQRGTHLFEPRAHDLVRKLVSVVRDGIAAATPLFTVEQSEAAWLSFYAGVTRALDSVPSIATPPPLVSVCITHFNRPALLRQALASVESQDYPHYEVILVDDGSNSTEADRYLTSIEPYFLSKGWSIIRTANNYLGAARNLAAQHARGKYILFLDDDNVAYPHQISTYVNVAEKTQAHVFSSVHSIFRGVLPPEEQKIERYSVPLGPSLPVGLFKNCFGDANFFVLREAFISSGGFTEEFGVGLEDHEFFANMIFSGYALVVIPEPLLYYRIHDVSSQMVFVSDPRLGEARRLRPYIRAVLETTTPSPSTVESDTGGRARRSMLELVARNSLNPREDCNQTLSSVSPNSGSISGGTTITIRGTGFSCGVSSVTIGGQECSGVRVISNVELQCITPPGPSVYISEDIVAQVAGTRVVLYSSWMYTPVAAPLMTWCKLQDTGVTILCYFDSATDEANSTNCALFTYETLSLLGSRPYCYWSNPSTVAINLGTGATITFNDSISVVAGSVRNQGASGQANQAVSVILQPPNNPVHPIASLSAPSNIGPCEGVTLDGSGSTGGAGRALNVTWALLSVSPQIEREAKSAIFQILDEANLQQSVTVELTNSSLSVNTTYTLSLVVTNWLEESNNVTVVITKQETAVPQVVISGPAVVQIYRNVPLTLQGSVTGSSCGGTVSEDLAVSYKWSVSPEISSAQGVASASLSVPANVLTSGTTYQFSLLVTDLAQPTIQNSANVTVVVGMRDLIAKISGGNQQYSVDEVIQLDGSGSSDPDNVAPLVYQWACSSFYDSTVPCNGSLPADSPISLDADILGHGKWLFTLTVSSQSNNGRTANASVYVEVTDSVVLSVSIEALNSSSVDPTQKLVLQAVLNEPTISVSEVSWAWLLVSGNIIDPSSAYSSPLTSQTLIIAPGALSAGTSYTYKVIATYALSNTSGSATITFTVASAPTSGGFNCPDSSGSSPDVVYNFDFGALWTSTSGITGYSISFLPNDGSLEIPLVDTSLNTKISTRLPTGSVKIIGYVYSGSGTGIASRQECSSSLSYSDPSQGLQTLADEAKSQSLSVYDIARIAYSAKTTHQLSSQGADNVMLDIRSNLLQQLQSQSGGISRSNTHEITAAIGSMIPLTDPNLGTLPVSPELADALNVLQSLVSIEQGASPPLDSNTLGANVEVLGNIIGQLNGQLSPQTKNSARNVRSVEADDTTDYWSIYALVVPLSSDIAGLYMGQASNGENALVISRNNLAVAVYKDTAQKIDAQGLSLGSNNIPTLSLSPGFVPEEESNVQSLQFTYLSIGGSPYPIDSGLSLVSNVVILDVNADGNEVALVDLQPTARLSVPMNTRDLARMQCMWHNDSAWATSGCETQTSGEMVICLCDRVATMAVMQIEAGAAQTKPASAGLSGVWIGVICGGVGLVLIGVLVGVFVVRKRRAARAQRGNNTPAAPAASSGGDAFDIPQPVVDPEAVAAAVATAASLSPEGENSSSRSRADSFSDTSSWSERRARTSSFASTASSPASSMRSGCSRTSSSSSEEEIMESEIKNIAHELNKQLPRDTRSLEEIVNRMDME